MSYDGSEPGGGYASDVWMAVETAHVSVTASCVGDVAVGDGGEYVAVGGDGGVYGNGGDVLETADATPKLTAEIEMRAVATSPTIEAALGAAAADKVGPDEAGETTASAPMGISFCLFPSSQRCSIAHCAMFCR
tara:strand:+ start:1355 stop:1756 length:402 start_codon:yes stop_codon:yes gene_type:complete